MAMVFFEGFNYNNGEAINLNTSYWSHNNGYSFQNAGRTQNSIALPNRTMNTSLASNSYLQLSNFTNPLTSNSCIGIGFWVNRLQAGLSSNSSEPDYENLISLTTNNGTLSIDCGRPSDNVGVLLVVRENDTVINTYDFRSAPQNSWNHSNANFGNGTVLPYIDGAMYLDLFFDATNGSFSVRAAGGNTLSTPLYNASGSASTAITSFTSVTQVKLYGKMNLNNWNTGDSRYFDDFYFTNGNSFSDVFLGPNTRIYRLHSNGTLGFNWQNDPAGNDPNYAMYTNNGDSAYIRSNANGQVAYYNFDDLPGGSPNTIAGVKLINIARKSGLDTQAMVNIMASSSSDSLQEIGPTYTINSETYSLKESMYFTNPVTSGNWTPSAINTMVLGVKNVS